MAESSDPNNAFISINQWLRMAAGVRGPWGLAVTSLAAATAPCGAISRRADTCQHGEGGDEKQEK